MQLKTVRKLGKTAQQRFRGARRNRHGVHVGWNAFLKPMTPA